MKVRCDETTKTSERAPWTIRRADAAAARVHGISTWHPRRRRDVAQRGGAAATRGTTTTRRRRRASPADDPSRGHPAASSRNIHAAPAAAPRHVSTEYPCGRATPRRRRRASPADDPSRGHPMPRHSTEYPRGTRGGAATCLHGISMRTGRARSRGDREPGAEGTASPKPKGPRPGTRPSGRPPRARPSRGAARGARRTSGPRPSRSTSARRSRSSSRRRCRGPRWRCCRRWRCLRRRRLRGV